MAVTVYNDIFNQLDLDELRLIFETRNLGHFQGPVELGVVGPKDLEKFEHFFLRVDFEHEQNDSLLQYFHSKFGNLIDFDQYKKGTLFYNSHSRPNPCLHVDLGRSFKGVQSTSKTKSGVAIIIPLEVDGIVEIMDKPERVAKSKTIFMKQLYWGPGIYFTKGKVSSNPRYITHYDPKFFNEISDSTQLDSDFYNAELSHIPREYFDGFEVEHVFPWRLGACTIHERNRVHTTNNYAAHGIRTKTYLLLNLAPL
jgi:hypothetical protein